MPTPNTATPSLTPTQTPTPSGSSAHRGFERFTFDFYDVERSLSVEITRVILHTILFQRAMGHVRPGSIVVLEQEFPCVRDTSMERVVEARLAEMKSQTKGDTGQGVRLKIALLQTPPSSSTSASSTTQQKEQQAKQSSLSSAVAAAAPTTSTSPADTQQTATRAGGYPYAWIAHAWSGGITGTTAHRPEESGGTAPSPSPSPSPATALAPATDAAVAAAAAAARISVEPDRFEEWVVSISLASSSGSRTERERIRLSQTSSDQLKEFVRQVIRFTDEKRLHIPSITTNELEPFPIKIDIEPLS